MFTRSCLNDQTVFEGGNDASIDLSHFADFGLIGALGWWNDASNISALDSEFASINLYLLLKEYRLKNHTTTYVIIIDM